MLRLKINKSQIDFCLWLLQFMIILSLSIGVIWLSTRPKPPIYTVVDFYVPAFDPKNNSVDFYVPSFDPKNNSLFMDIEISNPNKGFGIYYDQMNLTLYYRDAVVGVNSVASFYQGHKKTTRREISVISEQQLWKWASRPVLNGTVDLKVGLVSPIRYKTFWWISRHHWRELQAHVMLGSDGKMNGEKNIKFYHKVALQSIRYK